MTSFPRRASSLPLLSLLTLVALLARIALLRGAEAYNGSNPPGCVVKMAERDREAMRAVYAALPQGMFFWYDSPSSKELFDRSGNLTYNCCAPSSMRPPSCMIWCQIECTAAGRITGIYSDPSLYDMPGPTGYLGGSCPPGALSPAIGELAELSSLVLRHSCLAGDLPDSVTRLQKLTELDAPDNSFSGPLPLAIFRAPALRELRLEANNLTGELPGEAGAYSQSIVALSLRSNGLTGGIPAVVSEMTAPRELDLGDNGLSNQLSGDAAALPPLPRSLSHLNASRNNLTCSAGSTFVATVVDLSHNRIAGALAEVMRVSAEVLRVAHNELSGSIPADLLSAVSHELDLSHNLLSGAIPSLSGPINRIDLSYNNLTGELPRDTDAYQHSLESLSLRGNKLTGAIPTALQAMRALTHLDLGENRLSGAPTALASLRELDVVRLDGNALSGPFCDALLPARELYLGFNAFGGDGADAEGGGDLHGCVIPAQVEVLSAPHAGLRGSVPGDLFLRVDEQWGRIVMGSPARVLPTQILHVNLSHNCLTGSVKAISVIRNGSLVVSHNNFTGSIPEGLFRLASTGGLERGANGSAESSRVGGQGRGVVDVRFNELSGPLFDARRDAQGPTDWSVLRVSGNSAAMKGAMGAGYLPVPSPGVQASAAETEALLAVRDALLWEAAGEAGGGTEVGALVDGGNSSWAAILSNWDASSSSACEWYGVGCTADGHVHTLHLLGDATVALHPNVVPDMPDCQNDQLGDMSCTSEPPHTAHFFLQGLSAGSGSCSVSGSLSEALGQLTQLTSLRISGHALPGGLPPSLSRLSHLVALDLSSNRRLSGSIPPALFALPSLRELTLRGNNLTGAALPTTTAAAAAAAALSPSLESLDVGGNALSGSIAARVSLLAGLTRLALDHNRLDGSLPRELGALWMLRDLHLQGNALRGGLLEVATAIDASANAAAAAAGGVVQSTPFPRMRYLNASYNNLTSKFELNVQTIASVVDLSHNQIRGTLDDVIGVAYWPHASMDVLRLSHNQLSGEVPIWLLREVGGELDLSHNLLNGTLEDIVDRHWWQHAFMDVLRLSHNQLSGNVTSYLLRSVGGELDLSHNLLSGTLAALNPAMTAINLSHNNFSGAIPVESKAQAADVSALRSLDVSHNAITGGLPAVGERSSGGGGSSSSSSSGVTGLAYLDLSFNSFSGALAQQNLPFTSTGECSVMQSGAEVRLSHNALTGSIQDAVFSPCLSLLDLSHNHLSGPIPDPLKANNQSASHPALSHLDLSSNQLTGPIPDALITSLTELTHLSLSHNQLTGPISDALTTSLTGLTHLSLSHNQLSGSILPLSACPRCTHIDLSYNLLTGAIPDLLQGTTQNSSRLPLSHLDLSSNQLTRPISDALTTSLTGLTHLSLSRNQLSGSLLPVAACSCCTHMDLSYNLLSGAIPPLLTSSTSPLAHLNLSSNLLSGSLPRSLTLAPMLTHLDLSRNKLKGSLPAFCQGKQRLASLLLSSNAFSGPLSSLLPSFSSCASSLLSLNVSTNQLSGSLPASLSHFTALHSLQTARNRTSGSIPAGLASLKALQELDVSWSGLSGTIPARLCVAAPSLQVQLAGNSLSGSVPPPPLQPAHLLLPPRQPQALWETPA
ncbi:unnamed protein product [Closterium sp. Naga37s-1]|nr:unnamed protein product [Closterium sp. Naga37s-1]